MSAGPPTSAAAEVDLRARAARIRILALDVDGVLTDGGLRFDAQGDAGKTFSVRDGFGLTLLREVGIELAIITGRQSGSVRARAAELGITHVLEGIRDKATALRELAQRCSVDLEAIAYLGDDWPDLTALQLAGIAGAPADAEPDVRAHCHWISSRPGGHGAVREFAEMLLEWRGQRTAALARYLEGTGRSAG
jgi:3-deoxy-D-manno-octulosonate 8-phosphate phosphatase (KDO 8-P phosphatase)